VLVPRHHHGDAVAAGEAASDRRKRGKAREANGPRLVPCAQACNASIADFRFDATIVSSARACSVGFVGFEVNQG